jgi:rod shape-determining protein MreB and related proteins
VRGRDSISGLPRVVEVSSEEITAAIRPVLNQISEAIKVVLEQTPPELASDIIDKGIVMSGGTSLLKNLDKFFTEVTGVACYVSENSLMCVVQGTGIALENIELYKRSITKR